jgi:hypothetical protein
MPILPTVLFALLRHGGLHSQETFFVACRNDSFDLFVASRDAFDLD